MADDGKQPAIPTRDGLDRLYRAAQYVERLSRSDPPKAGRRDVSTGVRVAKTQTGGISAMSGDVPGHGNIELYGFSGTVGDPVVATGVVVTCFNLGGAIAAAKYVLVTGGSGGQWAVVEPC